MKTLDRFGLVLVLASAALFSQAAAAHASLKRSSPAAGATVAGAPHDITLTFDERLEAAFSTVAVRDASGKDVSTAKARLDAADAATLHLDLPRLPPGVYTVRWAAVSRDSHRRTGDFKFTVK